MKVVVNLIFVKLIRAIVIAIICALFTCNINAQNVADSNNVQKRKIVSIGSHVLMVGTSLTALGTLWYSDFPKDKFHFFNDSKEWMQIDKAGHAMGTYMGAHWSYSINRWAGFSNKKSAIIASAYSFTSISCIELLDGFSRDWGASWADIGSNLVGASMFGFQQYYWGEQRIQLKVSFRLTELAQYRPNVLGSNFNERIMKDYNGQTYWLSFNFNRLLKNDKIPSFINLALGYGANGMLGGFDNPKYNSDGNLLPTYDRYRSYYLSADIDLRKVFAKKKNVGWFLSNFGILKIPFPTLEFSKNGIDFHPLFY